MRRCEGSFGLIRKWLASDASAYEGAPAARGIARQDHMASSVWADTAYWSAKNEAFPHDTGFVSHTHCKKPKGKPMPQRIHKANAAKISVRSHVEHVFSVQKDRMDLFICTIGLAPATTKIGMANIVYNIKRVIMLRRAGLEPA